MHLFSESTEEFLDIDWFSSKFTSLFFMVVLVETHVFGFIRNSQNLKKFTDVKEDKCSHSSPCHNSDNTIDLSSKSVGRTWFVETAVSHVKETGSENAPNTACSMDREGTNSIVNSELHKK